MASSLIQISDTWSKSKPTRFVVLGNGESRKLGLAFAESNNLPIIAINDIPTGVDVVFSIVTDSNLLKEISQNNQNSISLIIPSSFPEVERGIRLPVSEFQYLEGTYRKLDDRIEFREDFVLLTILDVLSWINLNLSVNSFEVNLFGFDFKVIEGVENINGNQFLNSLLSRQKSIFLMLLDDEEQYKNLNIINHSMLPSAEEKKMNFDFIDKSVPHLDGRTLESAIQKNVEMQKIMFQRANSGQVQIVAELTNNHLGDTKRLLQMVEECKNQGADVIKIQKRDVDFLYTESERESSYKSPFGETLGQYRRGVELSVEQIELLTIRCAELEIPWFSSVLDIPSLKLIEKFKPICVKAPSTISNHKNFLKELANSNLEYVFISTGATDEEFISWVTKNFHNKNLVLMQCTSSYPTKPEDCNVAVVNTIRELETVNTLLPGYSSHDIGSLASQISIAFGAKFIEKHIKLGSVDWVHFDGVALDLSQNALRTFVDDLKHAQKIIGSGTKRKLASEHHKYKPNEMNN